LVVVIVRIIQTSRITVLPWQLQLACKGREVGLPVFYFCPRAVILPSKAQIHRKCIGNAPIVLVIESRDIATLSNRPVGIAALEAGWETEKEVGDTESHRRRGAGIRAAGIYTAVGHAAQYAARGIVPVKLLAHEREPCLHHVPVVHDG